MTLIVTLYCRAVTSTTSTLLFPLIPWILQLLIIGYGFIVTIYVLTLREQQFTVQLGGNCECDESLGYENGTICTPTTFAANCFEDNETCLSGGCYLNSTTTPWFSNYMHAYTVVAFFWVLFFISAFGEMVLAGTFVTWYWTFRKSDVPFFTLTGAVWRTLRYENCDALHSFAFSTSTSRFQIPHRYIGLRISDHNDLSIGTIGAGIHRQ